MAQDNRKFGLTVASVLCALALVRYLWVGMTTWWLIWAAIVLVLAALATPAWLTPVRIGWIRLAAFLGFVQSRLLLSLLFLLLITPMAMLLRALGKRPIQMYPDPQASSYWRSRHPEEFSARSLERQF